MSVFGRQLIVTSDISLQTSRIIARCHKATGVKTRTCDLNRANGYLMQDDEYGRWEQTCYECSDGAIL